MKQIEPAFVHDRGGPYPSPWSGISVRDYFAAQAMPALIVYVHARGDVRDVAKRAYEYADAMVAARQEP